MTFAVELVSRVLGVEAQLLDACIDGSGIAGSVHDRRAMARDLHASRAAEHLAIHVSQRESHLLGDEHASRLDGEVVHAPPAPLAVLGSEHAAHVHVTLALVLDEEGQCVAFDAVAHDQGVAPVFRRADERGDEVLAVREPLVGEQDVGVVQRHRAGGLIACQIGREKTAVEDDALCDVERRLGALRVVDAEDALEADRLESVGNQGAELLVLAGDGGNVRDVRLLGNGESGALEPIDGGGARLLHAPAQRQRVGTGGYRTKGALEQRLREHDSCRRSVSRCLVGRGGGIPQELSPHVLVGIRQNDRLSDGHPVVGHEHWCVTRRPVGVLRITDVGLLIHGDVSATWSQGDFHRVCQLVRAGEKGLS